MKVFLSTFVCCSIVLNFGTVKSVIQTQEIRELCNKAQEFEKKTSKLQSEIDSINQKERISTPIIRNIYEILARCFTTLFDVQRFSKLLILNQEDNKNDLVRCSIIIKNFASYFRSINSQLWKGGTEISNLRKSKQKKLKELDEARVEYEKLIEKLGMEASQLAKTREENIIQTDVIYHIAAKSESIEELDAELEAENAIGVLREVKISTNLSLSCPVAGKIVSEFGDKSIENEMVYYISFETCPGAIVTSPAKGVVVFSGKFLNYGNMIIVSNGEYRVFLYGIDILFTLIGDVVEVGDYIGRMKEKVVDNPVIKMELKKSGEPLDPRHWLVETAGRKGK